MVSGIPQQVGRLAVDGTQRIAHLGQNFLLAHHGGGIVVSALHQRCNGLQFGLERLAQSIYPQLTIAIIADRVGNYRQKKF